MLRRLGYAVAVGVPGVVLGAAGVYRVQHHPRLPEHTLRDLHGQVAVVTGATSGIGRATAEGLAGLGATLVVGARDPARGEALREHLRAAAPGATVEVVGVDMASPRSVRAFCDEVRRRHAAVHLVVAAAAEIRTAPARTEDGLDCGFATNHLGLQALAGGLEPALLEAAQRGGSAPRVVVLSSRLEQRADLDLPALEATRGAHILQGADAGTPPKGAVPYWTIDGAGGAAEEGFDPLMHYAGTKRANMLLALHLHRRWARAGVEVLTVSPGMVNTNIFSHYPWWFRGLTWPLRAVALRSPEAAARGVLYAAAAEEAGARGGEYLTDGAAAEPSAGARDPTAAARLHAICARLIRDAGGGPD